MDPGNQLNSREGCQENLTFLSKRQEVVTHLKAGGVRPGWGAGGESSLGLTKLKEQCPDSQIPGAYGSSITQAFCPGHFPGPLGLRMLFLGYREMQGEKGTENDLPSDCQTPPVPLLPIYAARGLYAETQASSASLNPQLPIDAFSVPVPGFSTKEAHE